MKVSFVASAVLLLMATPHAAAARCIGDCDGDGRVSDACPGDSNADGAVSIRELILVVRAALNSC